MSFRPPRLLNLGLGAGRPHLGPRGHGQINKLSQLSASTSSTAKPSFPTSTSTHLPHQTPRRPASHHHHHHPNSDSHYRHQQTRHHSSSQQNPNGPNQSQTTSQARIDRIMSRLPRFLHPYLSSLRSSPTSFIVAFLILHEITAIIPGLGFFYLFHYAGDDDNDDDAKNTDGEEGNNKKGKGSFGRKLEAQVMTWAMEDEDYGKIIAQSMERFERWFRRKGYFGFGPEQQTEGLSPAGGEDGETNESGEGKQLALMKKWQSGVGDEKYRVLVDAALAYGVTKALLPLRIIVSVKATPWFASVLGRVRRLFGGLRR